MRASFRKINDCSGEGAKVINQHLLKTLKIQKEKETLDIDIIRAKMENIKERHKKRRQPDSLIELNDHYEGE